MSFWTVRTWPAGAALAVLLGLSASGCTAAPEPDQATSSPADSGGAAQSPSAAADCPALAATVPSSGASSAPYAATDPDQSALTVSDGSTRAVSGSTISKSGDSTDTEASSFAGRNAAILVSGGSRLYLADATVNSAGAGSNGVFSTGDGSLIELQGVTVTADGSYAHAVEATQGGSVTGSNLTLRTTQDHSSAIATDRGGGSLTLNNGTAETSGELSAVVYSTGNVSLCGFSGRSAQAEGTVVEGANAASLTGSDLTGATHGAYLYSSTPGGSRNGGTLSLSGGSLTGTAGDGIRIEGVQGTVNVTDNTALSAGTGNLVHVTDGGAGTLQLTETQLQGSLTADAGSSLDAVLNSNSTVTGTLANAGITLDNTSNLTLTSDSTATTVSGALLAGTEATNITGNGHQLTYDPGLPGNSYLGGQTYSLTGGGTLAPR